MQIPELIPARQHFPDEYIRDIEGETWAQMAAMPVAWKPGSSVAVTVGSRGVANIARVVKAVVAFLREQGVAPFIVPAMGSHGGATAEGQTEVLASYGVTEEGVGAPIRSSMQTVELPQGASRARVFMDKHAWESDGVIVINRVKLHTDFHGPTESGLLKMCVIGLGKHRQALEIHKSGTFGLRELIPEAAREILASGKILMGLGLVENAYDHTMKIQAALPQDMEETEKGLLEISRRHMPSLPVDALEMLVLDLIGKDISGSSLDPNIIGRIKIRGETEPEKPDIRTIVALDLTEASHGNAVGIGLADFTTRRLFDKLDLAATYENALTSTFIERGKLPMIADSDRKAVEFALRVCRDVPEERLRVVRARSTLHLGELLVSRAVLEEAGGRNDIEAVGEPIPMFREDGTLPGFEAAMGRG